MIARHLASPPLLLILFQVLLALGVMVGGARLFVHQVEHLARNWGVSPLLLSLIIAPVATELPEKFNSIIWVSRSKDTLALGNITGAMVFQGSLLPALGLVFTPWRLGYLELVTVTISLASALVLYWGLVRWRRLGLGQLFLAGVFYLLFLFLVF
jgi:cation:H+ antiporter